MNSTSGTAAPPALLARAADFRVRAGSAAVQPLRHEPALDGVRAIAVLLVLGINSLIPFVKGGYIGVDIFFVLSGFLITALLTSEWAASGAISLPRFYARRALRLLPALAFLLLVMCGYAVLRQSATEAHITYRESVWVLFYYANWMLTRLHEVGSLDHAWSLSVEEQFYIAWPLLLLLMLRSSLSRRQMLGILATAAAAAALWRGWLWHEGTNYLRLYYGTDTRADALLVGCIAGLIFSWDLLPHTPAAAVSLRRLALVALGGLSIVSVSTPVDSSLVYRGGFTLIALAAGTLLLAITAGRNSLGGWLQARPLTWIGRISYSLYLWHYPVFHVLRIARLSPLHLPIGLIHLVRFAAVFALACISYYGVERPFLRLKHRFAAPAHA
jgi:peptidoglycan/LPS O-acetylase OafA/YrhL